MNFMFMCRMMTIRLVLIKTEKVSTCLNVDDTRLIFVCFTVQHISGNLSS